MAKTDVPDVPVTHLLSSRLSPQNHSTKCVLAGIILIVDGNTVDGFFLTVSAAAAQLYGSIRRKAG